MVNDSDRNAKTIKQMCHYRNVCYVTTLRTLSSGGEQHLPWTNITRKPSNISEAVIKKSKRKRLILRKMSQKIRIKN
jgi:hypothetical protein